METHAWSDQKMFSPVGILLLERKDMNSIQQNTMIL